jgi:5-deoxy-glucuronate isomerase
VIAADTWRYLSFSVYRLEATGRLDRPGDDQEVLVLILEGKATVLAGRERFMDLGTRASVFGGPPPAGVLVAAGERINVAASTRSLVAVASAPGGDVRSTRAILPEDVLIEARGQGNASRRVHHLLPPEAPAGRLVAFEIFAPGGNWSSYPPHKHDTEDPPREAYLEEVYFFRFAKPQGFAFHRVYTQDRSLDETIAVGDEDLVLVPQGYHEVVAAPGYDCYYLNVMAGPHRAWHFTVDPDHAWLMDYDPARPRKLGPADDGEQC